MNFKGAIIGHPVAHSLSPVIYTHWLARHDIDGTYERLPVAPEDLSRIIPALYAQGYTGLNVTLPHKSAVMPLCHAVDAMGTAIGAVNTLIRREDGFDAINTDWYGFIEALLAAKPDFDFAGASVLVLGAGGAARSVLFGLRQRGVRDIRVASRLPATELAAAFGATAVAWDARHAAQGVTLLVNTTPLGMAGQGALDFDVSVLPRNAAVYDIVYKPLWTKLIVAAYQRELTVIDGLGMLIHQARLAFHAWTGILPESDAALRDKLLAALDAA